MPHATPTRLRSSLRVQPTLPIIADAARDAILSLHRQAQAVGHSTDWPTLEVGVTLGYRGAVVTATVQPGGRHDPPAIPTQR